jgi:hypothetical protein
MTGRVGCPVSRDPEVHVTTQSRPSHVTAGDRAGDHDSAGDPPTTQLRSRSRTVKPGRLPVSEFAFDRAGAGSPFGDDITFPVPTERLTYEHPDNP